MSLEWEIKENVSDELILTGDVLISQLSEDLQIKARITSYKNGYKLLGLYLADNYDMIWLKVVDSVGIDLTDIDAKQYVEDNYKTWLKEYIDKLSSLL